MSPKVKMILKRALGFTAFSLLMPCVLLCMQAGYTTDQPTAAELQRLQGTWEGVMVGGESDGKITITIAGNSFHFHRDTNFWFETEITLPAGSGPPQLHATIKGCAPAQGDNSIGKVVVAIFKIEDGTLTLATFQDPVAAPKSFNDAEASLYQLRKVQPRSGAIHKK